MVYHLGMSVFQLADVNGPLRQLLRKDSEWTWDAAHQMAFTQIKEIRLSLSQVLALYNPERETIIAADTLSNIKELGLSLSKLLIMDPQLSIFCMERTDWQQLSSN